MPMFKKVISKSRLITGSKYVVSFLSFLEFMTNVGLFANPGQLRYNLLMELQSPTQVGNFQGEGI